jgi:uridine kinase
MVSRPLILGIAGGSGAGKTTVMNEIVNRMDADDISMIQHDSYYLDRGHMTAEERRNVNYDHPDSLDTQLLTRHLTALRDGQAVEAPIYDFTTHTRTPQTILVEPRSVIIVEGILILVDEVLRRLLDMKVFVDTDPDIRLMRRMTRDVADRGRSLASVVEQYVNTVRPMHLEFVEPSKRYADTIISGGGPVDGAVDLLVSQLYSALHSQETHSN